MRLVLLGQLADHVSALASALTDDLRRLSVASANAASPSGMTTRATPVILGIETLEHAPDWSTLKPSDLVVLLARTPSPGVDWRSVLLSCGQAFQVIHPSAHPLQQEVQWTLGHHLQRTMGHSPWPLRTEIPARWQGPCETCSDPECEHLLFRRLISSPASSQ